MPRLSTRPGRANFLERRIEQMQEELEFIATLPEEPVGLEDGTNVVAWKLLFLGNATVYEYAAIKSGDGKWYTTGPRSPKGYSWEDLIGWVYKEGHEVIEGVWSVTQMDSL